MRRVARLTLPAVCVIVVFGAGVGLGQASAESEESRIAALLEVARDIDPELADRLNRIRATKTRREFRRALADARQLEALRRLKEHDAMLYELKVGEFHIERRIERLAVELRQAIQSGLPEAEKLEKQLREALEQEIGYTVAARGFYLIELHKRVQELEAELDEYIGNRATQIERRMRELLGKVD